MIASSGLTPMATATMLRRVNRSSAGGSISGLRRPGDFTSARLRAAVTSAWPGRQKKPSDDSSLPAWTASVSADSSSVRSFPVSRSTL